MAYPLHAKSLVSLTVLDNSADRRAFFRLQLFRISLGLLLTFLLSRSLEIGVAVEWLLAATTAGILFSGSLLCRGKKLIRILVWHALAFAVADGALSITNFIVVSQKSSTQASDFLVSAISDQLFVTFLFYAVSFISNWFFWTSAAAATIEGFLYSAVFVFLMSGHRNYHLDAPKLVSAQTWKIDFLQRHHVEPQHLFIALGGVFLVVLVFYFLLAGNRPLFGRERSVKTFGGKRLLSATVVPAVLMCALTYYGKVLNARYSADLSRASQGVGEAAKEGDSNLGFHKAVGQTNQPAALVRLEGDYEQNPWAPMLYFREGALSEFNGKELVVASAQYDNDVPRIQPGQPYVALTPDTNPLRENVVQSVYLLMKHNTPFAIDHPTRIGLIKNPDPERFTLAYQAVSAAPGVKVNELLGQPVGDQRWDQTTLSHYLRAPGSASANPPENIPVENDKAVPDTNNEDLRYLGLTRQITGGYSDPLARAEQIINYLSAESIYTRDPGHQVAPDGDPVAPYLFAPPKQKRGYCVHFAHAAVYMLRLAGIPARIGTGYLTDLTYAKDGHILLQMGDRHAWPEIYIEGLGWTITDVNPAQAENEQAPVPDAKLLEELMNKINPTEDFIKPPEIVDDKPREPSLVERLVDSRFLFPALGLALTALLLFKLWLRAGYRLARSEERRIRLAYTAFASELTDLGIARRPGETRQEFRDRINRSLQIEAGKITSINERAYYSRELPGVSANEISSALKEWKSSYDRTHWRVKRYLSIVSPRSLFRLWTW
ncbi:MAG: transglutaminase-like domain-containing protein [Bdellovibrionota bacterium]